MEHYQLSETEEAVLQESNLISPLNNPKKRKVSASFLLSPPSSQSSPSGSSSASESRTPSGTIKIQPSKFAVNATIELPQALDNNEALEFVGFTEPTALHIFNKWRHRIDSEQNPNDLFDYVRSHVNQMRLPSWQSLTDLQVLHRLGIKARIIDAILNPQYIQIYGTASLQFWVMDTLWVNYLTLEQLLRNLKHGAIVEVARKKVKSTATSSESTTSVTSKAHPFPSGFPSERQSIALNYESTATILQNFPVVTQKPEILPDHVILYKGKCSIELVINGAMLRPNGSIDLRPFNTLEGGDFNSDHNAQYWTPDYDCAEKYRMYAALRNEYSETWLLSIQVPKTFLDTLNTAEITFSRAWKEYIYLCRQYTYGSDMPENFRNLTEANLIKGHILNKTTRELTRISRADLHQRLDASSVMTINGVRPRQWAFKRNNVIFRLSQVIGRQMFIEINPALLPETIGDQAKS